MTPERLAEIESKQCAEITCEECEAQRNELIAALRECRREAENEHAAIVDQLALLFDNYGWPKAATKHAMQAARKIRNDPNGVSWKGLDKELSRIRAEIRREALLEAEALAIDIGQQGGRSAQNTAEEIAAAIRKLAESRQ